MPSIYVYSVFSRIFCLLQYKKKTDFKNVIIFSHINVKILLLKAADFADYTII